MKNPSSTKSKAKTPTTQARKSVKKPSKPASAAGFKDLSSDGMRQNPIDNLSLQSIELRRRSAMLRADTGDILRRVAKEKLSTDKAHIADLSKKDMEYLINEPGTHQIELKIQNEELRRTQLELELTSKRHEDLYNFAPIAYLTLTATGLIANINLTGAVMLGISKRSHLKRPFSGFIPRKEDRETFAGHLLTVLNTRKKETCEIWLEGKNRKKYCVQLHSMYSSEYSGGSSSRLVLIAVIDITERKAVEDRLAYLASFPKSNPNPIIEVDASRAITYSNAATQNVLQKLGININSSTSFFPPDIDIILKDLEKKNDKFYSREVIVRDRVFAETVYLSAQFQVVRIYAFDITDRVRAEDKLKKNEAILKQAGQMTSLGAWDIVISNYDDINANPLYWSDEVYRIFGYEPGKAAVNNKLFFERVHPDDRQFVADAFSKAIAAGMPYTGEHRIIRPDGSERIVLEHAEITFDNMGRPIHVMGAVQDITELKRAEAALKESEEKFRTLTEAMPQIVWTCDTTGAVDYFNSQASVYTGVSPEDISGWNWTKVTHPDDVERSVTEWRKALESGEIYGIEHRFRRFDGAYRWHLTRGVPIRDTKGRVIRWIGTSTDIDDRKKAEENVLKLNQDMTARNLMLDALNRELDAFNHSISHDLRAPLRSMTGFATTVMEDYGDKLDETGKDYLSRILSGSEKATRLIDALLNLSAISHQEIERMDIDLSRIAESVIRLLRESYPERTVTVAIRKNIKAYVDANMFRTALTNLLGNAWKFTVNTENARVEFGTLDSPESMAEYGMSNETLKYVVAQKQTVYFVRDNGAGFDRDYAAKMFWPFHRLHSDKEFPGTGIGLAIVDRIVRRHGGRIWAEGAMGKGATIYFTVG